MLLLGIIIGIAASAAYYEAKYGRVKIEVWRLEAEIERDRRRKAEAEHRAAVLRHIDAGRRQVLQ